MFYPHFRGRCLPAPVAGKPTYYLFWARNAIYHGLKALRLRPDDTVLVPAYHCASAIEPICQYGARVAFYNVRRDGSPDFQDLQAKIDKSTRALLAIHYFGFPQPIRELQAFCRARRLYLIEDCAHVLIGEADGGVLGSFGDISVFSWRKFLPLYDGGLLVINTPPCHVDIPWERNSLFFFLKVVKSLSEQLLHNSDRKTAKGISYLFRYADLIGRYILSTSKTHSNIFTVNSYSVDFDLAQVNLRMSKFSKYLLQNVDFSSIIEKRHFNYSYLLKAAEVLPRIAPWFPHLPVGACPWVFPFVVHGLQNFHHLLRAKGIPAFTWDGVIHPRLDLAEFPDAAFLYHNLVLLPIHQDLGNAEMDTMIEVIAETLRHSN